MTFGENEGEQSDSYPTIQRDIREALKNQKELQRQDKCGNRTRIVKLIKMAKIGRWRADRA